MGAILSKLWPNRSNNQSNNNNNQPPLAITAPPVRLPLPSPPSISENDPASENKDSTQHQGKKASKKQSGQQSNKSAVKNEHPLPNQSFIYKTVLETTVSDANANEEEERKKAEEAPGPFEIETDLLSPEVEEAVIKIQANVRGYLTRKQYRATPERSIEKPSSQVNQEQTESTNEASSGILAPPPSFSDTPKELPLDEANQTANQGKRIAEKLIELEKQVSQAAEPYDKRPAEDRETNSRQLDDQKVNISNDDQSITVRSNESNGAEGNSNDLKLLQIPSIETDLSESSAPEEAATKIQAAFRGYQVRKTISREASPMRSRDKTDDKGSELDEFADKEGKVNLRERVSTSAQDPERESILVLDQLEEALSKELLKTPGKTEDESSSSSNSTDIDLNSSIKSNSSLVEPSQVENDSTQKVTTESLSKSSDIEDKQPQDSLINTNSPQSDDKSLTNNLKNDNLSSTNIESVVCTQSSKLMQVNDPVPNIVASDLKESEILDPSSNGNNVESIANEPVVFVSNEDKVDASPKLESEEAKQETDAVVMVEVAGKLNASPLPELTSDSKIGLSENLHVKSNILHEIQSDSNENNQPKNELKLDSPISMETEEVVNQFVTKSEETTDSKVDQIPTCDILSKKETDSLPQPITSNEPQSVQESEKILVDTELPSPQSVEPPTTTVTSDISKPNEPSNDIVKETSSDTMESKLAEEKDIKAEENEDLQNEPQKNQRLLKEDSFGSDILILDDDSIDRSDTLYDIIAEKGLNVSESSNQQQEKDKDLSLHDQSGFSFKTDASESFTEMKDDILVNLDESDDEDENKNIEETISTKSAVGNDNQSSPVSKANNESDQLSNEKVNTSISNDSVSSHLVVEEHSSLTSANSTNDQISTSVKPTETSSETHVQLSENFKDSSDKDLSKEQLENNDIATNETIIQPINESLNEQIVSTNMESCLKEPSSSSDDQLEKSDKISAIVPDEHSKEDVSQENVRSQEVSSVDKINPETDLKPLEIEEKTNRDLSIGSEETLKAESKAEESSAPKIDIENESEECSNKTEFIDQKSISQTPVTINVQTTVTTAEAVQEKPDENSNAAKDDKDSQSQSRTIQDDSTSLKQTKESESNLHSEPSTGLNLDESSSSTQSVVIINQPEIVESSGASELPTSSTESTPTEESDDKTEDSNPEDENRLLRIVDREARSKSPNPFGRKRRKGKKGRAVQ
ncbi:nucleoprotein TPR isoform X2 [Tetranychus urticae]|uniref:nucleoprotein TPR isoform X2 n=1 Tax=Tetranychus urticae TaxID=32264 RepID=UPI000D64FD9E|nr:nucleoprotein TPR isoform X2 [Tetranychus urticae]